MPTAYLGLGSDLGNRSDWLRRGIQELSAGGLRLGAVSSLYLTEPTDDPDLPWFLNAVAEVLGAPPPLALLETCMAVEHGCGRRRSTSRLEARTLDIDVLLYDQQVMEAPGLSVPHPRMHERRFVLRPLSEIAPAAVHPPTGKTVQELLRGLTSAERVWLMAPPPGSTA